MQSSQFANSSANWDARLRDSDLGFSSRNIAQKIPSRVAMSRILKFLKSEDGPTAVEYAVMLALIIAVCIAAIGAVGNNTRQLFNDNNNKLNSAW